MENIKIDCEQEVLEVLSKAITQLYNVAAFSNKEQDEKDELYEIINRLVDYRHKIYKYDIRWESVKIEES